MDPGVEGYEALVDDIRATDPSGRQIDVVVLDPDRDGISQLSDVLSGFDDLDGVHIISHAEDGAVQLGSGQFDAGTLADRSAEVATWADALTGDADLLFYGCELAETDAGRALVDQLSQITGADVAASDDLTGASSLGGDWNLEYRVGELETQVAVSQELQANWQGVFATYTVSTTDESGTGSLRQAIDDANAGPEGSTIEFTLAPGSIIELDSILPAISVNDLTIDASSGGVPGVVLDGDDLDGNGFTVTGDGVTIRGFVIHDFDGHGIRITGDGNTVAGNYIGTNADGTSDVRNRDDGVRIDGDNNTIGGTSATDANLISGNSDWGISFHSSATNNLVIGNLIGTDKTGTVAVANKDGGILLSGAGSNTIGGVGLGNVVSGNGDDGIYVSQGADDNVILGNYVGVNAAGTAALANADEGIEIHSSGTIVGGSGAGEANVISGNKGEGIKIQDNAGGTQVIGNKIGTDASGTVVIGNRGYGVRVTTSSDATIGGVGAGDGNIIAGNKEGVHVESSATTVARPASSSMAMNET